MIKYSFYRQPDLFIKAMKGLLIQSLGNTSNERSPHKITGKKAMANDRPDLLVYKSSYPPQARINFVHL